MVRKMDVRINVWMDGMEVSRRDRKLYGLRYDAWVNTDGAKEG